VRWLEPQEEQALRRVVQARWPEREPELDLALHTGLRWAGQYNLRWTDVNLERKLLTLPKPKGGKLERVPISSQAAGYTGSGGRPRGPRRGSRISRGTTSGTRSPRAASWPVWTS
jgi:integrase